MTTNKRDWLKIFHLKKVDTTSRAKKKSLNTYLHIDNLDIHSCQTNKCYWGMAAHSLPMDIDL